MNVKFHIVLRGLFFSIFLFNISACSTFRESGVPLPEMDNTETGITTGVVLGAGLGAIVGSTAGQAGAGALVGGVAGGTTGGVIGKTFDIQEKRIEEHDKKLGINTSPVSGASVRSRLWAPADYDPYANNRPSGNKGVASRHISPSIKVEEKRLIQEGDFSKGSANKQSSNSRYSNHRGQQVQQISRDRSNFNQAESNQPLAKRYEGESTFKKESTPNEIDIITSGSELPPARNLAPVRRPAIEVAKTNSQVPVSSQNTKNIDANKKVVALTPPIAKQDSNKKASTQVSSNSNTSRGRMAEPATKTQEKKQEITPSTTAKVVNKPVETKITCEKGKAEVQRARSSASDSDKVFYLRRAILACPEDSGLRVELGKIYSRLGLKDDARKEFSKALDFDPTNDTAQDELSIMMLESNAKK